MKNDFCAQPMCPHCGRLRRLHSKAESMECSRKTQYEHRADKRRPAPRKAPTKLITFLSEIK